MLFLMKIEVSFSQSWSMHALRLANLLSFAFGRFRILLCVFIVGHTKQNTHHTYSTILRLAGGKV